MSHGAILFRMYAKMPRLILIAIAFAVILFSTGCGGDRPAAEPSAGTEPAAAQPAAGQAPAAAPQATASQRAQTPGSAPASASQEPRPAPKPAVAVLDAGTVLKVRTTSTLSTKSSQTGDTFEASLEEPVLSEGRVVFPKGTMVRGRVIESDPGGRVKGVATIALALTAIDAPGEPVRISTSTVGREAPQTKKKDAMKVGIGAGVGAAIGAIAGGGKGAAIGAAAGGGAGTGAVLATRGDPAVVPAESVLRFTLKEAVKVELPQ